MTIVVCSVLRVKSVNLINLNVESVGYSREYFVKAILEEYYVCYNQLKKYYKINMFYVHMLVCMDHRLSLIYGQNFSAISKTG